MKILYGVVGEGMGHAIRSRVVIEYLLSLGHQVEIMASSRACDFLSRQFGDSTVNRIHGFHLLYEENRVRLGSTLWSNVQAGIAKLPQQIAAYFQLLEGFEPDAVISDFESWTYLFGLVHRLPSLSIDNMQIINRCQLPSAVTAGAEAEFQTTKAFIKGKLPFCSHYLISTFFRPPLRKPRTTLVPPILRPEVLNAVASRGEHLLVYQTSEGHSGLLDALARLDIECRVYGVRRAITAEQREGKLRYMPFSEQQFVEDLASARGVVAAGGFTLMGEAVYLRKPMLSIPLAGQFEQLLNARYLEHEGYGLCVTDLEDTRPVAAFLSRIGEFEANLAGYAQRGNEETFNEVIAFLDRAQAGVA